MQELRALRSIFHRDGAEIFVDGLEAEEVVMAADSILKSFLVGRGAFAVLSFTVAGMTATVNDAAALITSITAVVSGVYEVTT